MSEKERRRQLIDMEWLKKSLDSYIESLGLTVKNFQIYGHPDNFNPHRGVTFEVRVLGPELPTPNEFLEVLKSRFGDDYFTIPDEDRRLPEEFKGAMYLGSVKDRHLTWEAVRAEKRTNVHYFVLDDAILPFNDEWILEAGPRPILMSYENLKFWAKKARRNGKN